MQISISFIGVLSESLRASVAPPQRFREVLDPASAVDSAARRCLRGLEARPCGKRQRGERRGRVQQVLPTRELRSHHKTLLVRVRTVWASATSGNIGREGETVIGHPPVDRTDGPLRPHETSKPSGLPDGPAIPRASSGVRVAQYGLKPAPTAMASIAKAPRAYAILRSIGSSPSRPCPLRP